MLTFNGEVRRKNDSWIEKMRDPVWVANPSSVYSTLPYFYWYVYRPVLTAPGNNFKALEVFFHIIIPYFRTKKNFAANLRIIMNVSKALGNIILEMISKMTKIDNNLDRVRRNLDTMELQYEGIFRKVNRLIA